MQHEKAPAVKVKPLSADVVNRAAKKMKETEKDDPNEAVKVGCPCFLSHMMCCMPTLLWQAQSKVRKALRRNPDDEEEPSNGRGRSSRGRGLQGGEAAEEAAEEAAAEAH